METASEGAETRVIPARLEDQWRPSWQEGGEQLVERGEARWCSQAHGIKAKAALSPGPVKVD